MKEKDLLKKALSKNVTDKYDIYRRIVLSPTKPKRRSLSMKKIIIIAASFLLLSTTVFASVKLLSPREVAEDMVFTDESGVTYDHFATPFTFDNAVEINESHTDAGFKITFMGFAHGEGIDVSDLAVDNSKTYAVIAIENEDGTPIETMESMLTVSPLVNGMNPGLHNAFTFGASGMGTLIDGVQYQLMELDVIEYFAAEKLYLSVSDAAPSIDVYLFDEQSGEITANPDYKGLNVLFDLPIDSAKADSAKVDEYLTRFETPVEDKTLNEGESNEDDILEMSIDEVAAIGELVFEDIVTANSNGEYDIYWNETNIFTTMQARDVATFELGVPTLFSISGNDETSKVLFIERTSDDELKTSVYEVKTNELD